jgi:hypothetical protein
MQRRPIITRIVQSLVLAAGLLAGGGLSSTATHAARTALCTPIICAPPPIRFPCTIMPNAEQISLLANDTLEVVGTCFQGTTDYVAVFDKTQGSYLTNGGWQSVTTDGAGNFVAVIAGAHCWDQVEALAYDSGRNSYANGANWQTATLTCVN